MKIANFRRLKAIMERTASASDHEALAALRAANRILMADNLTWDRVLSRSVTVIDEVEAAPVYDGERVIADDAIIDLIAAAKAKADTIPSPGTKDFVYSVARQWDEEGWISPAQSARLKTFLR
jgi:hypothetical protein